MSPTARAWLARAPALLGLLAALYVVVHTTTWMVRLWDPTVFWDSWSFVEHLLDWSDGNYPIARLWEQHNEHRILFPRLVFFADHLLFQGRQLLEPVVMWLNQLVLALLLVRITRGLLPRPVVPLFFAFTLAALFAGAQMENFLWAFQVQFVGVLLAAVAAFHALAQARERRAAFVTAVACMVVASFTMSNGLLVWPLGAVLLCAFRVPRGRCFELVATGAIVVGFYLYGYTTPAGHAEPLASLARPTEVLAYLLAYLGSPLRELGLAAAIAAGAGGILTYCALLWGAWRARGFLEPATVTLLAVATFALGTAALTALGRVSFPLSTAMTSRYSSPALLYWVALVALVCASVTRRSRGRSGVAVGLLLGLVLLLAWRQKPYVHQLFGTHEQIDAAALALQLAPLDPELMLAAYPHPGALPPLIELLRERRWSTFHEGWHELPGRPLGDCFRVVQEPIPGGIFAAEVRGERFEYLMLRGWSAAAGDPRQTQRLVLADPAGTIVGLGRGGHGYPLQLGRTLPPEFTRGAEWQALMRLPLPGPQTLHAYVVQGPAGDARPLGGPLLIRPYESAPAARIGPPLLLDPPVIPAGFAARSAPDVAPPPDTRWTWWGSYVGEDADVGQLTFGPLELPPDRVLVVPYITGPSTGGLRLRALDALTGRLLASAEPLTPSPVAWRGWVLRLPPDAPDSVRIVAEDAGVRWGQWIAVGPPCALLPPSQGH